MKAAGNLRLFILLCFYITAVDDLYRTSFHTGSTICTLVVINGGVEVINDYRFVRTFFLAYLAANTAVFTYKLCGLSVIAG